MYRKWTRGRRAAALLGAMALLAACGGGDGNDDGNDDAAPAETTEPEETVTDRGQELDVEFADDLVDDGNGWGEFENETGSAEFTDTGFELTISADVPVTWFYPDAGPLVVEDSSTTVEVDEIAGTAERGFGVTCRLSRTGLPDFYTLTIDNDDGTYAIARWGEGDETPEILAEGEDEVLEDVGEDEPVEVTGTCLGEGDGEPVELALAVDGEEIASVTDDDGLAAGVSGIAVTHLDGDEGEERVPFTEFEVRGDVDEDAASTIQLEDDFSDPGSGWSVFDDGEGNSIDYADGTLVAEMTSGVSSVASIRGPLPDLGTASVTVFGDLTERYAGVCLNGPDGQYEFAVSGGGYGSVGFYSADGSPFSIIDEVSDAFAPADFVTVTAGWNTDGTTTNIDLYVDGERVASAVADERMTSFTAVGVCGAIDTSTAPAGTSASVTFDNFILDAG